MELLAPAGDPACLQAALEAGADAVYLGLESLNARRRASNFNPELFRQAVAQAHAKNARVYLTLNIDLAQRELGEAARALELAAAAKADAILVRDPALFAFMPIFPELEFHLSTQACIASSADAQAAKELGAKRVVLARELDLEEIAAASAVPGIETEVFVQGALCFSISGRCLLSSWAGGRSGNRGACTSPCRVPWTVEGEPAGTPLSMKDLALWKNVEELKRAKVTALKIEGRLKNPEWVRRAVAVYRKVLSGEDPASLASEIEALGGVAGREHTDAYLHGKREDLTGVWGRKKGAASPALAEPAVDESVYDFEIKVEDKLLCTCTWAGKSQSWIMPKTKVVREAKAVSLAQVLAKLSEDPVQGLRLASGTATQPELMLPPRAANAIADRLSVELRLLKKKPEGKVKIELREAARKVLEKSQPNPDNRLRLSDAPDRVRIQAGQSAQLPAVVEGLTVQTVESAKAAVVALPSVFFEADIPGLQALLDKCAKLGLPVEVNSLGGWKLAKAAGMKMEGGPGLGVLNSLAARQLMEMGLSGVTASLEADSGQLEELCACCPAPLSIVVYGRPPLMTTRARIADAMLGKSFADRRGVRMSPRLESGLTVFRPNEPFDWRGLKNPKISARHLVMDLAAEAPAQAAKTFNYERGLY